MVSVVWPLIKDYLNSALAQSGFDNRYNIDNLFDDIQSNNYLCWVVTEKNVIKAAAITEIVDHPHGKSVYVFLVGGVEFDLWGDEMQKEFVDYAKCLGARWIDALVRPGFGKVLSKKYGYRRVNEMITMRV